MLRIYYADTRGLDLNGTYSLSAYRREKLKAQQDLIATREGLGAELLLHHALQCWQPEYPLPPQIVRQEYGKPVLENSRLHFNLSHSDGWAVCGLSDRILGVDLQMQTTCRPRLAERYFTQDERDYIRQHPDADYAFTKIWSMKECYGKARGLGLQADFTSFSVLKTPEIRHQMLGKLHLAVCTPGNADPCIDEISEIRLPGSVE